MRLSDTRFFCWRAGTMQRRFERKSSLFVQLVDKLGCDELVIHADNVIVSVKLPMAYFRFCVMPYGVQSHQILWTDRFFSAKISTSTTATVFDRDNIHLFFRANSLNCTCCVRYFIYQRVSAYYEIHLYLYCEGRGFSSGHYSTSSGIRTCFTACSSSRWIVEALILPVY